MKPVVGRYASEKRRRGTGGAMLAVGIEAGVGVDRLATVTPSDAGDAVSARSTQGPQCEEEMGIATADAAREAALAPSEQPSGPLASMATRPSPSKQSTTPSSNPAKPRARSIGVSARRRGTDLLTVPILMIWEYRPLQTSTQVTTRRCPGDLPQFFVPISMLVQVAFPHPSARATAPFQGPEADSPGRCGAGRCCTRAAIAR